MSNRFAPDWEISRCRACSYSCRALAFSTCWHWMPVPSTPRSISTSALARESVSALVDQTPPDSGKNPRPVLKAKVNEPIRIKYVLTNVYPHKTLENVVVHFYIARQDKVGQKELPDLKDDVVMESAFDMDFKPGSKAGQRTTLKIDTPGVYLIRVESRNTQSDHEHFAAIDLVVADEAKTKPDRRSSEHGRPQGALITAVARHAQILNFTLFHAAKSGIWVPLRRVLNVSQSIQDDRPAGPIERLSSFSRFAWRSGRGDPWHDRRRAFPGCCCELEPEAAIMALAVGAPSSDCSSPAGGSTHNVGRNRASPRADEFCWRRRQAGGDRRRRRAGDLSRSGGHPASEILVIVSAPRAIKGPYSIELQTRAGDGADRAVACHGRAGRTQNPTRTSRTVPRLGHDHAEPLMHRRPPHRRETACSTCSYATATSSAPATMSRFRPRCAGSVGASRCMWRSRISTRSAPRPVSDIVQSFDDRIFPIDVEPLRAGA